MTRVSDTFRARWRSGKHVGAAKPRMRAYFRVGTWHRAYWPWANPGEFAGVTIPGETAERPFHPIWTGPSPQGQLGPFAPWQEIPNVLEVAEEQGFDENGIKRFTMTVDNVDLREQVGPMGALYHAYKRGYLSPHHGYAPPGRPREFAPDPAWVAPDGDHKLWGQVEIRVDQGYGDAMHTTIKGVVDDLDFTARPGQMVMTFRDFGQVLIDSRLYGWNKSKQLFDPVTFVDREQARDRRWVGAAGPGNASSSQTGYPPRFATDGNRQTEWRSHGHTVPYVTEWVEIVLDEPGTYDAIRMDLGGNSGLHEVFIGIHARHFESGAPPTRNGVAITGGWVEPGEGGLGYVPGADGGWAYVRHLPQGRTGRTYYLLGAEYRLGGGSRIRVGFRNLQKAPDGLRRARVQELKGVRRVFPNPGDAKKLILVSDVADVVRVILRWAGFKEWIVESTGMALPDKLVCNRGDFYIDVINKMTELTGYVFFMGDPTGPDSLGVPIFRESAALRALNAPELETGAPKPLRSIRHTDLLTGLSTKFTDEPLSYLIIIRGKQVKREDGGVPHRYGGDPVPRYDYRYYPPWTKTGRMVGFLKYFIRTYKFARSVQECEMACYLTALQEALKSATAIAQIPGNPEFCLDDHVYLVDEATGTATRLWVASRQSTFRTGKNASWVMSLGGSLIDTPDIVHIKQDIVEARRRGSGPPPQDWARPEPPRAAPEPVEPIVVG
jgi:hypothetical protein